jgi:protein phosphatase
VAQSFLKIEQDAPGIRCAAVSDVGMRRASNQDAIAVALSDGSKSSSQRGHLLVVADGMGAHAAGELASQLATENIPLSYLKRRDSAPRDAIVAAVEDANRKIHEKGQDSVDFHGMGTTCSCLLLLPEGALAAHVGDSRVYRLRGKLLEQLTFDHSLVWEMAAAGEATEDEVPAYVPKNVITRSLGPHPTVQVDLEGPLEVLPGDRYLLCSDGLTGPLSPPLIGMVAAVLEPTDAAQTLVDLANLLGGPDNISVIVAETSRGTGDVRAADPQRDTLVFDPRQTSSPIRLACWSVAAVAAGLSVLLAVSGSAVWLPVAGFAAGALAAGWFTDRRGSGHLEVPLMPGRSSRRPGEAPYRCHQLDPSPQNIEMLSDIVRQIEDLEAQRDWGFDWTQIHADRGQALAAMGRGDFAGAVRAYCSAVRRLMRELRNQGPDASDSTINLDED